MKFFSAMAQARFAEQIFAAAGFDFTALAAAGDANALKSAIEAKVAAASAAAAGKSDNAVTATLNGEIIALKASLDAAKVSMAAVESDHAALAAGLADAGVKVAALPATATDADTKAAVAAAIKSRAATLAQEQLAASGHAPIAGEPAGDPTAPNVKKKDGATGLARVTAAFTAHRKS